VASELPPSRRPTVPDDTLSRIVDDLEKYAGWLGKGDRAAGVRLDLQTLRMSIAGSDYFELQDTVQALVFRLNRVPDGSVRRLFQKGLFTLRALASQQHERRAALAPSNIGSMPAPFRPSPPPEGKRAPRKIVPTLNATTRRAHPRRAH
jgi:hypothetical protein